MDAGSLHMVEKDLERQDSDGLDETGPTTPWDTGQTSQGPAGEAANAEHSRKGKAGKDSDQGGSERLLVRLKREMRRITLHFTPSWFSVNMGTGISSILLHELPYQFNGLGIIANVIFGLNVLLFVLFLAVSIARYTVWPKMWLTMVFHPSQSLFLGTFAMGLGTIVNMCALSAAPAFGHGFVLFTWALWWFDSILSLLVCIGVPFLQFTRHEQSLDKVTGVWFLPVVSPIVAAASGGIVAELLPPAHARLTLIVSWILWGTGFSLAFLLMALYYGRLAIYKIPPATLIVSAFLPLGSCGQGAFGLLKISSVLYEMSKKTGQALVGTSTASASEAQAMATAVYAVTMPIALVLWGLGLFWLVLALAFLVDLAWVQKLQFNLGWWGFTFPLGVFCTATTQLGKELDSGGFRVLGTVLSLIEVALWLFIAIKTTIGAFSGKLFFSPCLAEQGGEPPPFVNPARKYQYTAREKRRGGLSPLSLRSFSRPVSVSRSRGRSP